MIVTTLFVGTVPGAVYSPPLVIDPVPVPLTDQFTRVLLRFTTVAVHCEVPSTVTAVGVHVTVMVGFVVVVVLLPQELRNAGTVISARKKRKHFQRKLARSQSTLGSNTRNPPAGAALTFLRKTQLLLIQRMTAASFRRNASVCR